eukprot:TRINITY_DN15144_c0_g1_i1.p1 TRINITY_DN15144_c0_g1~~TRINITY_DN15144_c0_g1_i1.p1  ORF type:complete len:210 (-),score=35.21 TRINITY_DN15144_c0_g1_i1:28-630(-)
MDRPWTSRDKCKVWCEEAGVENERHCALLDARVMAIVPNGCVESPWRRYIVTYKGDHRTEHRHSAWELFSSDDDAVSEDAKASGLDEDDAEWAIEMLHDAFEQICTSPDEKSESDHVLDPIVIGTYLERIPLPLGLKTVEQRLKKRYYRSLSAFEHDIEILGRNTRIFFGPGPIADNVALLVDEIKQRCELHRAAPLTSY